jgi:hypothetical protein
MAVEKEMIVDDGAMVMEPKDRLLYYQAEELSIGRVLNANEYAEFLLGYLVQNQLIKAKYCYMRAVERHANDAILKRIWSFGDHICKKNIAVALSICKAVTFEEAILRFVTQKDSTYILTCAIKNQ